MKSLSPRERKAVGLFALFLGLTYPALICAICGAVVDRLDWAWDIIVGLWITGLSLAHLPPFILVAAVTALGPNKSRADRLGLVAMWLGLFLSQTYMNWSLSQAILAGDNSGFMLIGYVFIPWISLAIVVLFLAVGFLLGLSIDRFRRAKR